MKYNLKKIALLAEIFGGIAIIVSLIFVGIQFKENTKATKSATANAANAITVAWYSETGNSAQSSQLMWDYVKDPKSITSNAEKYQVTILLHGLFLAFQNSYYLAAEGTLDQNINESLVFHAGTSKDSEGNILTNGGRVIAVTSYGNDFKEALSKSYNSIEKISFDKMNYRKDIGFDL